MGYNNKANGKQSTVVGQENSVADVAQGSSVFGFRNYTSGEGSISLGILNNADGKGKPLSTGSGNFSLAVGHRNNSVGKESVAFGGKNRAIGIQSSALGISNYVTGDYSIAIGRFNNGYDLIKEKFGDVQSGVASSAIGVMNNAVGENSSSLGNRNISSGTYSNSIGAWNYVSGERASAVGYSNISKGKYSNSIGARNYVSGYSSIAIGIQNNLNFDSQYSSKGFKNTGDFSSAFGISNVTAGERTIALGHSNKILGNKSMSQGINNYVTAKEGIAIGFNSLVGNVDELNTIHRVIAIGSDSVGNISDGVAVGSFTITSRNAGGYGFDITLSDEGRLVTDKDITTDPNISQYRVEVAETKLNWEKAIEAVESKLKEIQIGNFTTEEEQKQAINDYNNLFQSANEARRNYDDSQAKLGKLVGAWQGQLGAVAIGDETTGRTRQITGVAAGSEDTDAVNVAQLKAVAKHTDHIIKNLTQDITNITNNGIVTKIESDGSGVKVTPVDKAELSKGVTVGLDEKITIGGIVIDGTKPKDGEIANSTITGLTNTEWDGKTFESGRAATEGQLQVVDSKITNIIDNITEIAGATTIKEGDGNIIAPKTDGKNEYILSLNKNLKVGNSITVGDTVKITNTGIDAGNKPISNVEAVELKPDGNYAATTGQVFEVRETLSEQISGVANVVQNNSH